jgi:predicted RNA-binding protein associated with RNAse of E/G family
MVWAIYDDKKRIVEWYFDITRKNSIDENNNPYCDDLYLDVALMPDGHIVILDEDELQEAYNNEKITKNEYEMAFIVKDKIIKNGTVNVKYMETLCKKIIEFIEMK